ncbi:3-phosphoshikimate 1-carboxyvinyltransferase [Capnocytophaga sp. H2931]|uniref:3-phosphoshikimate 1-carboxyvinyltransferase n=1 Tax=Capnocytophaga sp. H2931 TaxID=1945657 RepID=UPI000BB1DF70|nr:3-phosphoshikimate 1-carboxyvinyltransferase [Capnocytophaga sp. H2931]ATA75113.1 3-phosphoshikimate 1-carboxyvinyltransferase [Capnocytophaga sp. H2931]
MNKKLNKTYLKSGKTAFISGSKSETNRLLLLQALFPQLEIVNMSNSDDSQVMIAALEKGNGTIDIHHAGTAMRFLTAFFATQEGKEVVLTGSSRMKERPIHILIQALQSLGAEITYLEKEGFPPLKVVGKELIRNEVSIPAEVSSQYISALMLVAPSLPNGLIIHLIGKLTSVPYIKMTLKLLEEIGVTAFFENATIVIHPLQLTVKKTMVVESDWSSASYWYSFIALSEVGTNIHLQSYKQHSLQGDSVLSEIYAFFGVETTFLENEIRLQKKYAPQESHFSCDLRNAPDIAQTIAVTCFGLGVSCDLTGLHTLKIKETDRLQALKTELTKLGGVVKVTAESFHLNRCKEIRSNIAIDTYDDHRMAMAFAPLCLKSNITINNSEVVSKSYPDFWSDVESIMSD